MRQTTPVLFVGAALVTLVSCAEPKPVIVAERVPPAARPGLLGIYHSSKRPTKLDPSVGLGEVKELRPCPFDPRVVELPPGGGILLRIEAPVPTDLRIQTETSQGPQILQSPDDPSDEVRLVQRGSGYFYENTEITRSAPSGAVVPREIALWPGGLTATDRRIDLAVRTLSFDPRATGPERESPPLYLAMVGVCPDVAVSLSRDALEVQYGRVRRLFAALEPKGDGVRQMKTTLTVEGLPKGVKATVKEPVVNEANWTSKRETPIDFETAADALPTSVKLQVKVTLAGIERRATLNLTVLPKPE